MQGKPYADAMTELLFKPLGMERTTLRPLMAMTYPFATGHAIQDGKPAILRPLVQQCRDVAGGLDVVQCEGSVALGDRVS